MTIEVNRFFIVIMTMLMTSYIVNIALVLLYIKIILESTKR
jgi:hypothetical protein